MPNSKITGLAKCDVNITFRNNYVIPYTGLFRFEARPSFEKNIAQNNSKHTTF